MMNVTRIMQIHDFDFAGQEVFDFDLALDFDMLIFIAL
jgi:hypothetical protein